MEVALASRKSHTVHLTHNDLDAIGADAIHRMKYGDVFTIFTSVGKFPKMLGKIASVPGSGDLLSISDFGYQSGVEPLLGGIKRQGWVVEWRDHHRWQDDEVSRVREIIDTLRVDTSTCACGITAKDLMPDDPYALELAAVVCDYDLWRHEDPRSAVLGLVTSIRENRTLVRDKMVGGVITDAEIERLYAGIKEDMAEKIRMSLRGTKVYVSRYRIAFAPLYGYPSETAAAIRKELNTGIEVIVSPGGRFSIRSVPPISHLIAREFRGGGHPNASGGTFDFNILDKLLFRLFKKNWHYRHLAEVAESIS